MTTDDTNAAKPAFPDLDPDAGATDYLDAVQKRLGQARAITNLMAVASDSDEGVHFNTMSYASQAVGELLDEVNVLADALADGARIAEGIKCDIQAAESAHG